MRRNFNCCCCCSTSPTHCPARQRWMSARQFLLARPFCGETAGDCNSNSNLVLVCILCKLSNEIFACSTLYVCLCVHVCWYMCMSVSVLHTPMSSSVASVETSCASKFLGTLGLTFSEFKFMGNSNAAPQTEMNSSCRRAREGRREKERVRRLRRPAHRKMERAARVRAIRGKGKLLSLNIPIRKCTFRLELFTPPIPADLQEDIISLVAFVVSPFFLLSCCFHPITYNDPVWVGGRVWQR